MPSKLSLLVSNPDPVSKPIAILGIAIVSLMVSYVSGFQVRADRNQLHRRVKLAALLHEKTRFQRT
jgi:hypothetical protein